MRTALQKAESSHTVVVGEDTDLLILLLYHLEHHHWPVYLGNSRSGTTQAKFWDIQKVQDEIGSNICQQLLFVHAISGCDTTSAVYGLGKAAFLKKAMKSASFREEAKKFRTSHCTKDTIEPAGEKVLVEVYGGRESDTLNKLRHVKYNQKLSTCSTTFHPCNLPPTSSAAKFHSQRTYFQVQDWMNLDGDLNLDPFEWGWEDSGGILLPILTDEVIAPEQILNGVKCKCKTDCLSALCSCRKHGLACSSGCEECRGGTCQIEVLKS